MNNGEYHRLMALYAELDRKISKLQYIQGSAAKEKCARSITKLRRHILNVKQKTHWGKGQNEKTL